MFKVKEGINLGGKVITGTGPTTALTISDVGSLAFQNSEAVSLGSISLASNLTGADGAVSTIMLKDTGYAFYDSSTTNALNYTNGSCQRWAPNTGAQTLSITNWPPSNNLGELLIQGVDLGAATITWPTINWIKSDGTMTTTFASNGVTLQASGTDFICLWTRDSGTTIYGKIIR